MTVTWSEEGSRRPVLRRLPRNPRRRERPVSLSERECRASLSGLCLELSMGYRPCALGECVSGDMDDMAAKLRADSTAEPKRAVRRPRKIPPRPR